MPFLLKVLGSLNEVNDSQFNSSSGIAILKIKLHTFSLLIYSLKTFRVFIIKLLFHSTSSCVADKFGTPPIPTKDGNCFSTKILNVLCLPFPLFDVVCTKFNVWAVGQQVLVDLKPYVLASFKKDSNSDSMDTDKVEDFNDDDLFISVKVKPHPPFKLDASSSVQGFDTVDSSILICSEDKDSWLVECIVMNDKNLSSSGNIVKILNIPKVFDKLMHYDINPEYRLSFSFLHFNDGKLKMLEKIFGINCPASRTICLVGHPDGSILWAFCEFGKQYTSAPELHCLFSVQQTVVGMEFVAGTKHLAGHDFFIVLGSMGKLTVFSPVKLPSSVAVSGKHTFWVLHLTLQPSIKTFVVVKNCILHAAKDGTIVLTDLSRLVTLPDPCSASKSSDLRNITKIECIDKEDRGVILLQCRTGSVYLAALSEGEDSDPRFLSLPSLLNVCLEQSTKMQQLMRIRAYQRKLFMTLSSFASIQFGCVLVLISILKNSLIVTSNEKLSFSICAINVQHRKYVLNVNLKALQKFDLDSDLCLVSVSVFSRVCRGQKLISRTQPYSPGLKAFSIQLVEADLQCSSSSLFPLFVEVGLTLQLPDHWKAMEVLSCLSSSFPYYLAVESFLVHELHLLKNSDGHSPYISGHDGPQSAFKAVRQLAENRPVSNLLTAEAKLLPDRPVKFSLCLTLSSLKKVMEYSGDVDACEFLLHHLLEKPPDQGGAGKLVLAKNCPFDIAVSQENNSVVIQLTATSSKLLIGLRMAVAEITTSSEWERKCSGNTSAYVSIPASLYRKCEELSNGVMNLFGSDIYSLDDAKIMKLYLELRGDISAKLPLL